MMSIEQEFTVFLSSICTGVLVSAVYGVIRVIRRLIPHSLFWISIEDLIYWVWFGIYVFIELHRTCSGRIRWFFVAGIGIGMGGAGFLIFKFIKNYIDKSNKTS